MNDLRERGTGFTAYFCNPNVHPLLEWRRRLKATQVLCEREGIGLDVDGTYGLVDFLRAVSGREEVPERCEVCYHLRLDRTAERAKTLGFDAFSTTLLASTEQDRELLRRVASEVSADKGLAFMDADWRPTGDIGRDIARKMSLYRQQYCGCIYSEYDRYKDTTKHLYRGGGPQLEE